MARKKKEEKYDSVEREIDAFSVGSSEGLFEDTDINDSDSISGAKDNLEFSKNLRTFNLPSEDASYSYLLSREKDGEIIITNRELFPMKEGYILACVEYELV